MLRRSIAHLSPQGASYYEFLTSKVRMAEASGFAVSDHEIHPSLKPHQRVIVQWAVRGGRRAIFAAFGLGKTRMQIEALRLCIARGGGRALIVAPLGVRAEFIKDGQALGAPVRFIRSLAEAEDEGLYVTNYETVRDGKLDPNAFTAVSLDEASVLRSFGSKTYQTFLALFADVRYRFVATATPSPNRFKELIHYAGFLGTMDTGQALTRFFQRNAEKANDLTLYPHKEREFWLWVSSWGVFLQRPSDLGFSDEGYDLPPLTVRYREVKTDLSGSVDRDGQTRLFRDGVIGLQSEAKERRSTLPARMLELREVLDEAPGEHFIIWHDLEAERHAIEDAVPECVSIFGAQELEDREAIVADFAEGRLQYLAAKPILAGSGCNLQRHCHRAVFVGVSHKFNDFIQAIHRIQRFLQDRPVIIDIIHAESEREIVRDLQAKWSNHNELVANMERIIREYGLNREAMAEILMRSIGVERVEVSGRDFTVANNDCVDEVRSMPSESIDMVVTSIPFSNHYEYTPSYNDFGHTDDDAHFFAQMDFLSPELLRVLKPGRIAAIHVKDRILFGSMTGFGTPTVNPFHAKCITHYQAHGFAYMGMITVVTDVVRENNQTYRLGWTENCKDGTKMGVGSPEYVLLLRKLPSDRSRAYADVPVTKDKADYSRARWQVDAHAMWRSSGDRLLTADDLASLSPDVLAKAFTAFSLAGVYDFQHHVKVGEALEVRGALPATFMSLAPGSHREDCWHDVTRMRTLNGAQHASGREKHVCPLQFDIVDRLIERYTNKGDVVFDPFGGLFTVPYRALKLGRRGRAVELNHGYFLDGIKYLEAAEREASMPTLLDLLEPAVAA